MNLEIQREQLSTPSAPLMTESMILNWIQEIEDGINTSQDTSVLFFAPQATKEQLEMQLKELRSLIPSV